MSDLSDQIQRFYNSYFGRPADPSGINFWTRGATNTGDLIGSAISAFGSPTTPEFAALYPAGTPIETFIQSVYRNMFNRTPDAEGQQFWADGFRAKVGGGESEGMARAWIVSQIEEAAWDQVGTNDKLSVTNKQLVGNAMTASVREYGTEAGYVSDLPDARALLASVNHTQASVNTALGRIKFGFVDGVDPSTGAPAKPPTVVDAGAFDSEVILDRGTKQILNFESSSDAPFTYRSMLDGTTVPGAFTVSAFEFAQDRLDFSAFNLNTKNEESNIARRDPAWATIDWLNWAGANPDGTPYAYKTYISFFQGKTFATWEINAGQPYNSAYLFVDANQNGNLDPHIDIWLEFSGTSADLVTESIFIV